MGATSWQQSMTEFLMWPYYVSTQESSCFVLKVKDPPDLPLRRLVLTLGCTLELPERHEKNKFRGPPAQIDQMDVSYRPHPSSWRLSVGTYNLHPSRSPSLLACPPGSFLSPLTAGPWASSLLIGPPPGGLIPSVAFSATHVRGTPCPL